MRGYLTLHQYMVQLVHPADVRASLKIRTFNPSCSERLKLAVRGTLQVRTVWTPDPDACLNMGFC